MSQHHVEKTQQLGTDTTKQFWNPKVICNILSGYSSLQQHLAYKGQSGQGLNLGKIHVTYFGLIVISTTEFCKQIKLFNFKNIFSLSLMVGRDL